MDDKFIKNIVFVILIILITTEINRNFLIPINTSTISEPLWDIGTKYLPDARKYAYLVDVFLFTYLLIFIKKATKKKTILCEFTNTVSIVLILRLVTMTVTHLPSLYCYHNPYQSSTVGSCNDCIFSGHNSVFLLCSLFGSEYLGFPKPLTFCITLAYSLFIISTHSHYTVDVILSYYIVTLIFIIVRNRTSSSSKEIQRLPY